MADIILEVQHILPATGWFFGKPYLRTTPLSEYEPVVVFVQVTVIDSEYLTLGPTKKVFPLSVHDYQNLNDLVGTDTSTLNNEIFYQTQFEAPEPDDD